MHTEEVVKLYVEGNDIDAIAQLLGVSKRSIITRLSHAKVYKATGYTPKYASRPYSKIELVELIEAACHEQCGAFAGLETTPKQVLIKLLENLGGKLE